MSEQDKAKLVRQLRERLALTQEKEFTDTEDREEYAAANILWVPPFNLSGI